MSAVEGIARGLNHLEKLQVWTQNQNKKLENSSAMRTYHRFDRSFYTKSKQLQRHHAL